MPLSPNDATQTVKNRLWPLLDAERARVHTIDRWMRWDHDSPHKPRHATQEYRELAERAQAPWGRRIVTAATDQMYVDGYRPSKATDDAPAWQWWKENGLDARQIAIYESMVGYGLAYTVVTPGKSWLGEPMPVVRALDPSQMIAVYEDPAWDDWPVYALRAEPTIIGTRTAFKLRLYDATSVYRLVLSSSGDGLQYIDRQDHDLGVCPIVRYSNHLDLRGRATGEIEPVISVLARIDQTAFDRLVVQRFSSWAVRYIAGMTKPDSPEEATAEKLRLKVEDILVADDPDTKFGTLAATPLGGFIDAEDHDVRVLAALTQSPAHELIGQMSNLSAEALAAAEASLTRRVTRTQTMANGGHGQTLRLAGHVMGDKNAAQDFAAEIQWRDLESRSLSQEADALGKLATLLQIPVEVLWDKVSILTQTDVERCKTLVEQGGVEDILRRLEAGQVSPEPAVV